MAEKAPEFIATSPTDDRPDLYLVSQHEELATQEVEERTDRRDDVLIDVVIEVNGQERPLCINISRGTLGNDQSVASYFDRFADIRQNPDGTLWRDYRRVELLTEQALSAARRQAIQMAV